MSISTLSAQATPATQSIPAGAASDAASILFGVGALLIGLVVAWALRVFRPRSIIGPPRLVPGVPAAPLLLVTMIGLGTWLFLQVAYGEYRRIQFSRERPGESFSAAAFTSHDYVFLSTLPFLAGLAALVVGDGVLARGMVRRIGYPLRRLPGGLLRGLLATLAVVPLMIGAGNVLEVFYRLIGFEHEPAHQLLTAMKDVSPAARAALVFGACVLAPLFEELLFRGHIQTLLTRAFALAATPWAAVLVTSVLFAAVHPSWTAPLIFLLSVCVGYAYERTGNLWVPIFIHALFNASQTLLFLYIR